jgi:hypothetical protein
MCAISAPELSRTLLRWTVIHALEVRLVRLSGSRLEAATVALQVQVQKPIKRNMQIVRTNLDVLA